jgi:hypothetical protein
MIEDQVHRFEIIEIHIRLTIEKLRIRRGKKINFILLDLIDLQVVGLFYIDYVDFLQIFVNYVVEIQ